MWFGLTIMMIINKKRVGRQMLKFWGALKLEGSYTIFGKGYIF
jgi:hypothetical protein